MKWRGKRGRIWYPLTLAAAAGLMFAWVKMVRKDAARLTEAAVHAKLLEDASAVDPAQRSVPLGDGRVMNCWSFPLRSYDQQLQRCVVCEEMSERTLSAKPQLSLSCSR